MLLFCGEQTEAARADAQRPMRGHQGCLGRDAVSLIKKEKHTDLRYTRKEEQKKLA